MLETWKLFLKPNWIISNVIISYYYLMNWQKNKFYSLWHNLCLKFLPDFYFSFFPWFRFKLFTLLFFVFFPDSFPCIFYLINFFSFFTSFLLYSFHLICSPFFYLVHLSFFTWCLFLYFKLIFFYLMHLSFFTWFLVEVNNEATTTNPCRMTVYDFDTTLRRDNCIGCTAPFTVYLNPHLLENKKKFFIFAP